MSKKAAGESASVEKETTEDYTIHTLQPLLGRYAADDIYNVDETGLFYKLLPDRTYTLKGEDCHGGKNSKVRITLLLGANMTGTDKLKPLVIGKSMRPRCYTAIRMDSLPVTYRANKKEWMTSEIFNQWLSEWNSRFQRQRRIILLMIDNCPAHKLIGNYTLTLTFTFSQQIPLQFCNPWTKVSLKILNSTTGGAWLIDTLLPLKTDKKMMK